MALSITNNIASLVAQQNLNKSNSALNTSLQRLSSGLKINSGADSPAGLVISNEQGAQIAGLQSAIENTNQAVSLIQTGEGALGTVNDLLVQIRGLALSAANSAVNDPTALAADQSQIQNALDTINRIANNTQFGTKKLLDGSAGVSAAVSPPAGSSTNEISFTGTASTAPSGTYSVNVTQAATKALVGTDTSVASNSTLGGNQTLTINGTQVNLTAGQTISQAVATINGSSNTTGVTATQVTTKATTTFDTGATSGSDLSALTNSFSHNGAGAISSGDTIKYSGVDSNGKAFSATFTYNNTAGHSTLGDLQSAISTAAGAGATVALTGNAITITGAGDGTGNAANQGSSVSLSLASGTGGTVAAGVQSATSTNSLIDLTSNVYGSAGKITLATTADQGFNFVAATGVTGQDVAGTINGQTGVGSGNVLSGPSSTSLSTLAVTVTSLNSDNLLKTASGNVGSFALTNNSLTFQIGANGGQTATFGISDSRTNQLATGVTNTSGFQNLGQINVTTSQGAQDTLNLVDSAINQVSTLRGNLGSFQTNTLQATASNLQTTLTNTTAAQSVIRDTDFAAETANFTKNQVLVQAGTTVLTNANATAQLILNLLK